MSRLDHPNVVKLNGIMINPLRVVMELCNGGDFHSFLKDSPLCDDWRVKLDILKDIAKGMTHLHGMTPPIVHRDLRSPNIFLIASQVGKTTKYNAKVGDFGLSQQFATKLTETLTTWCANSPIMPTVISNHSHSCGGLALTFTNSRRQWLAPEVIDAANCRYSEQSDVYSFAMLIYHSIHPKSYESFVCSFFFDPSLLLLLIDYFPVGLLMKIKNTL